jgi:hypothetical protein
LDHQRSNLSLITIQQIEIQIWISKSFNSVNSFWSWNGFEQESLLTKRWHSLYSLLNISFHILTSIDQCDTHHHLHRFLDFIVKHYLEVPLFLTQMKEQGSLKCAILIWFDHKIVPNWLFSVALFQPEIYKVNCQKREYFFRTLSLWWPILRGLSLALVNSHSHSTTSTSQNNQTQEKTTDTNTNTNKTEFDVNVNVSELRKKLIRVTLIYTLDDNDIEWINSDTRQSARGTLSHYHTHNHTIGKCPKRKCFIDFENFWHCLELLKMLIEEEFHYHSFEEFYSQQFSSLLSYYSFKPSSGNKSQLSYALPPSIRNSSQRRRSSTPTNNNNNNNNNNNKCDEVDTGDDDTVKESHILTLRRRLFAHLIRHLNARLFFSLQSNTSILQFFCFFLVLKCLLAFSVIFFRIHFSHSNSTSHWLNVSYNSHTHSNSTFSCDCTFEHRHKHYNEWIWV